MWVCYGLADNEQLHQSILRCYRKEDSEAAKRLFQSVQMKKRLDPRQPTWEEKVNKYTYPNIIMPACNNISDGNFVKVV